MKFFVWLKNLFKKEVGISCGGVGCVTISDPKKNMKAKLYYNYPTSDQKLEYVYLFQNRILNKSTLKKIKESNDVEYSVFDTATKEVVIPFSKKVFSHSEGYIYNGKSVDDKPSNEQFDIIKEYYSYHLIKMMEIAFEENLKVKKKSYN